MQEFYDEIYFEDFIPDEIADERKGRFIADRVRVLDILNKEINLKNAFPVADCLDMRGVISDIAHEAEKSEAISEEEIRIAKMILGMRWADALKKAGGFFDLAEHYPDRYIAVVASVKSGDKSLTLKHEGDGKIKIIRSLPTTVGALSDDISKTCDRFTDIKFSCNGITLKPDVMAISDTQIILGLSEPYTP